MFCPYSLATRTGRAATFDRYRRHPAAGARMLWLEHIALALNEKQGLIAGKRAIDHVRADGGLSAVIDQFHTALTENEHAIYELRRLTKPARDPAKKGVRWRAVRALTHGSRSEMLAQLNRLPGTTVIGADGIARRVVRDGTNPADHHAEHFYVAAPAGVAYKKRAGFEMLWRTATHARRRTARPVPEPTPTARDRLHGGEFSAVSACVAWPLVRASARRRRPGHRRTRGAHETYSDQRR
ncbi:hypothetical protein ACFVH4_08780 [Nocardia ignorata]|uniref:hypothetical protein n=1 Tax=Nocardia ignorata TaxID=145285 RepID=UPI003628B58C